jgi:hypothetical protein
MKKLSVVIVGRDDNYGTEPGIEFKIGLHYQKLW